ncbi:hypothetical protein BC936DRAFT_137119 [Jimgerdemannia flammicorona]|uniref:Uncharacterized protein n=1 Tax=Jimgerdemannia flammicorona TaxID=994334 RepID=A0A433DJM3_9FUNG|nr:hypothetical protein BC936DRAFT_137119 [Jimgerdemannia flammicorona]
MSYRIQCKQGIVGGIVAPTVKQLVEIEGDKTGATVRFSTRKARREYNTLKGEISGQEVQTLVSDLRSELHNLPTEQPVGAQDIYGFDISISFDWNDFHWQNGGPEGCVQFTSSVQPTVAQKQKFKELVDRILEVGKKFAIQQVE